MSKEGKEIVAKLDEILTLLKEKNEASKINHENINIKLDKLLEKDVGHVIV